MQKNISLIYPLDKIVDFENTQIKLLNISDETLHSLELNNIFDLAGSRLNEFFSDDKETIEYRQRMFSDLIANEKLSQLLLELSPVLNDISEIRRLSDENQSVDSYLYSITEVELYITAVEQLYNGLKEIKDNIKSEAFTLLTDNIFELVESEYYKDLNKRLKELTSRVREVKSVTIGVNLDSRLLPEKAGVLSVNNERFKSGDLLQKILRLDFRSNEYTCIASLTPFKKGVNDNQQNALNTAMYNALNDVFKGSMKSWKKVVDTYVLENSNFLIKLAPEIEFVVKAVEFVNIIKETGNELTFPTVCEKQAKIFDVKGLYNPVVATKLNEKLVLNDFVFDKNGMFYILSGPNRGGKSVITCAIGHIFALCQLGLPVPANEARISPVDGIFTHFPTDAEDTIDKGRLGEECARLDDIFDYVTEYSLVLLDESLSSTGSYEASYIASEVLSGISMAKCRGVFSTHLHELASMIDNINNNCTSKGGERIDTLVAGMEEGERSFIISRRKPDGKSYASDIASKYGISLDKIMKKIEKNK